MAGYDPSDNDADLDWALLARVLEAGAAVAPADQAALRDWIGDDVERRRIVETATRTWHAAAAAPARYDVAVAKQAVRARLDATVAPAIPFPRASRGLLRVAWRGWPMAIAATILVAIGGVFTIGVSSHRRAGAMLGAHDYVTASGQRQTVTLIDGTQFTLAPGSRVRVPATYGHTTRDIALDGEAYFSVVHDVAHPFAVRIGGAVIQDVGTEFDVRGYVGDSAIRIAVARGAVMVRGATGVAPLQAADMAIVTASGIAVTRRVDIATYTGWLQSTLTFDDTPLRTVATELARWYDVDVRIADSSIANRRLTATFGQRSADEVLSAVAQVLGVSVERHGRQVVFRAGSAVRLPTPATPTALPRQAIAYSQGGVKE